MRHKVFIFISKVLRNGAFRVAGAHVLQSEWCILKVNVESMRCNFACNMILWNGNILCFEKSGAVCAK